MFKKWHKNDVVALVAGTILPFAFAPFYLSFIGLLSPALLLLALSHSKPKQALKQGFLFGLGFFSLGISWIYVSLHTYGQAPVLLALFITALFILYLAGFFAVLAFLLNFIYPSESQIKHLIVFPSLWVVFELLRTWLFTGFPWLLLGYSQTNTWLSGFAPVIGVYGISYLVAMLSGLVFSLYLNKNKIQQSVYLGSVILIFIIGWFLQTTQWTSKSGDPLKVTLIQGNIDQDLKWQPGQIQKTLSLYGSYTAAHFDSDLIVWPEAAITIPLDKQRISSMKSIGLLRSTIPLLLLEFP